MSKIEYYKPDSLDEAWDIKKKFPKAEYIAGGTDILVQIKDKVKETSGLISLRSIPELNGITTSKGISIGAMTSITDLINHPAIQDTFPVLIEAAQSLGSTQIRNAATVGGNLCNSSPCANMAPPLLVLDAKIQLKGSSGERVIPLHDFFLGPGENCIKKEEILTAILLDAPSPDAKAVFFKKGRIKMDIAIASIAILLDMKGDTCSKARFAAGSVAPIPARLYKVEEILQNSTISKEKIEQVQKSVLESISPITDIRSSDDYRHQIIQVYVKRAFEKLLAWN